MQEEEGGVILQKRDTHPFIFPLCDLTELGSKTGSRKRLCLYVWLLSEAQVNPLQIQVMVIRLFLPAVLVGVFSLCQNQLFNLLRLISEALGFIFSCRHCTLFGVQWWGGVGGWGVWVRMSRDFPPANWAEYIGLLCVPPVSP